MPNTALTGLSRARLRLWLLLFFLTVAIPAGLLIYQAYSQMRWETFHQNRLLAEELTERINLSLRQLVDREQQRTYSDYSFLLVSGESNFLQRSPLATFPVSTSLPGLIGYFQVDHNGVFSSPLVPDIPNQPDRYGIPASELAQRLDLAQRIETILSENQLASKSTYERSKIQEPDTLADLDSNSYRIASTPRDDAASSLSASPDNSVFGIAEADEVELSAPAVTAQAAFDLLKESRAESNSKSRQAEQSKRASGNLGRVDELKLDQRYQAKSESEKSKKAVSANADEPARSRKSMEQMLSAKQQMVPASEAVNPTVQILDAGEFAAETASFNSIERRITTFESEIDTFDFSVLDSGHIVLFRTVWREGQRSVQGLIIEQEAFLQGIIEAPFRTTALARMSDISVAYQGELFSIFKGDSKSQYVNDPSELTGTLLTRTPLIPPFADLELIFSVKQLPLGPGAIVIGWLSLILILVLCIGFALMYRLGGAQIDLTHQQQDFVSAVSHELKTPLTSIRMYGEMLREGWASEDKKSTYYDYIYDESERLSRLIENVLQLARMTRNDLKLDLMSHQIDSVMNLIESRISSQVERASYSLNLDYDDEVGKITISVDVDCLLQIIINLVDNSLKFSKDAETKVININASRLGKDRVEISVRDFGPGISRDQMKKIFRLFYRSENELTRETVGTGIGLSLVQQLVHLMDAKIDVTNANPGARFTLVFAAK